MLSLLISVLTWGEGGRVLTFTPFNVNCSERCGHQSAVLWELAREEKKEAMDGEGTHFGPRLKTNSLPKDPDSV